MFFICEHCNESLKKSAIVKHALMCRGCFVLTCLDCNVRFEGDGYKAHNTCISEAEKYQKTAFRAKPAKRDPQAEWCAVIEAAAAAPGPHRLLLGTLTGYPNCPRKLKPFISFAKNSLKVHNEKLLGELFAAIVAHMPPRPAAGGGGGGGGAGAGDEEGGGPEAAAEAAPAPADAGARAGRKRRASEASLDAPPPPPPPSDSKAFFKVFVKAQLHSAPGGRVKERKLRVAALAEAAAAGAAEGDAGAAAFDKVVAKLLKKGKARRGDHRGKASEEGRYLCLVS
jgi:hypothetical protein